jgi:hypothetical protein
MTIGMSVAALETIGERRLDRHGRSTRRSDGRKPLLQLESPAMSDPTQMGDFRYDVDAVRRVNTEDQHRKVYERAPAVARARAMAA